MNTDKKALVVYTSRSTGNTLKVAEAIQRGLGAQCDIFPAADAPKPDKYDFIILGFGVYRGWPDGDMRAYMAKCRKKDVGIFMTLGAWPDSEHAFNCMGRAEGLLNSCKVRGKFICHGRLDPAMGERMKLRPAGAPHSWDEQRAERVAAAESRPDENDLAKAQNIFKAAWEKIISGVTPKSKKEPKEGILLAAFGTTVKSAAAAYENIERMVKAAHPDTPVLWAYTSRMVRNKLGKSGVKIKSVRGALNDMFLEGFTSVKVISLHVVPGEEYHKMLKEISTFSIPMIGFEQLEVSPALLSNAERLNKLCDIVYACIPASRKAEDAVVFMGHGNHKGHCELNYLAMAAELKRRDKNIFLATVEGTPGFEAVREEIKDAKCSKAYLMPLMVVAGDHACNDLAGPEDDSWKSILETDGMTCIPVLKGLGEYEEIGQFIAAD
jgi:sirohydrochlorin cobaltochelatase